MNINFALIFFAIGVAFFFYNAAKKIAIIWKAKPENRFDKISTRLKSLLIFGFGQKRVFRNKIAGVMHAALFWGFFLLFLVNVNFASEILFNYSLIHLLGKAGNAYLAICQITSAIVILSVFYFIYRRIVTKPKELTLDWDGLICLFFILGLKASDLYANTFATNQNKIYAEYGHLLILLSFLNYMPFSKYLHIFLALPNIFFKSLKSFGYLPYFDVENEKNLTAENQKDFCLTRFSWKQMLDTFACMRCGRCDAVCPANISDKSLSPKTIIQKLNKNLARKNENKNIISSNELWNCTTCGACQQNCPIFIEHLPKIIELRRFQSMIAGNLPPETQLALENVISAEGQIKFGNPYGTQKEQKEDWTKTLPFSLPKIYENQKFDILLWVGCGGASDSRLQKIPQNLAKIMHNSGVKFGILGKEEICCGEWIRKIGNEYLFQIITRENIEIFKRYGIKEIITFCPHCYNTFKNEYQEFGSDFKVWHHTEFLANLMKRKKLHIKSKDFSMKNIVYHDPCYLGRYNNIYEEPRRLIDWKICANIKEMGKSREDSFCCGGGGGRAFMEETEGQKINDIRLEQLLKSDPDIIATACPFCFMMLDDSLKKKNIEDVKIMDIAEILNL
ncbi:MAG: hypothetical protein US76_01690 [Parcubacteria group bacterium GW2011_GWA2_38_13b]|nr:MAG: hypothetical protein US76_01690 [Parcubacteria group bacterium GW2011_GWA2_38_13b]